MPNNPLSTTFQVLAALNDLRDGSELITAPQAWMLLALYDASDAMTQASLEAKSKVGRSAISRNLKLFGPGNAAQGVKGLGLLESYPDPVDERINMVRLTPMGRTMLDKIAKKVR